MYDIAMKLSTNRYYLSKRWRYSMSSLIKNPGTWAAGYSNPNLMRRRGSRICPVQTRLRGREVTLKLWCTLQVSGCPAPRLKCLVLTHPWTKLDMYYSTTCVCENKWRSYQPPQSLVVYMTPSNYAVGLIMPNYYWNFRGCLRCLRQGWSLQQ